METFCGKHQAGASRIRKAGIIAKKNDKGGFSLVDKLFNHCFGEISVDKCQKCH